MEMFIITGYTAICIAVFTGLRIPLNRWTVPSASIGGAVLIFTLVQMLGYYHPHTDMSRQYLSSTSNPPSVSGPVANAPIMGEKHNLVAWFNQNSLFRLDNGSAAEVTFDSIPGKVFSGKVQMVLPTLVEDYTWAEEYIFDPPMETNQSRIPVLISITDPRYEIYVSQVPSGSHAQTTIYGEQFQHLAMVRKTLLRMSAWMNYLSVFS